MTSCYYLILENIISSQNLSLGYTALSRGKSKSSSTHLGSKTETNCFHYTKQ